MKKITMIIASFMVFGMISFAQVTPFTISGKVTDLQSNPAMGRTVYVMADSSSYPWSYFNSVTTDSSGNYSMTITPPSHLIDFIVGIYDCQQYYHHQTIQYYYCSFF